MNSPFELFVNLYYLSAVSWGLYCFYTSIRIMFFIVKRYEQETYLLNSVFFLEHATFTRYLPDFLSSAMYACHLLMCVWGWRIYANRKVFRDIKDPDTIIRHFSEKEIRLVKKNGISVFVFFFHMLAFCICLILRG